MGRPPEGVEVAPSWPAGSTVPGVSTFHPPPAPSRRVFALGAAVGGLLALVLLAGARHFMETGVTIRNATGFDVHRVRVEGQGVWEWIGDIPGGEAGRVRVRPRGEGHYVVRFMRESGLEEEKEFGYYTPGSCPDEEYVIDPLQPESVPR